MALDMDTRVSRAMTFSTAPRIPTREGSLRSDVRPSTASPTKSSAGGMVRRSFTTSKLDVPALGDNIKRWDGKAKMKTEWDYLRRDPELWDENGDCFIYLYAYGTSKRGASFRVSFDEIVRTRCAPLIKRFLVNDHHDLSRSETSEDDPTEYYNIYIPAPPEVEGTRALLYHLATRNFFAWLRGKSMVGLHLGGALVGLVESLNELRSEGCDNLNDVWSYMELEGYSEMRNHPDHALAVLYFAEYFQREDLWMNAYAHCAGMNDLIVESSEYEHISRISSSLINQGLFEMEVRLDQCGKSLGTILKDEMSAIHKNPAKTVKSEVDRFRTFLHYFYVEKLGSYPPLPPPDTETAFPMDVLSLMYSDFKDLYSYLVDDNFTSSDVDFEQEKGNVDVLQCIQEFDRRHRYTPLLHPKPQLPETPVQRPQRRLSSRLNLSGGKPEKAEFHDRVVVLSALTDASNNHHFELLDSPLVKAFRDYEKQCIFSEQKSSENNIRFSTQLDARKVRWTVIYGMFQMLSSAIKIPDEVVDTDVEYNLCVRTPDRLPWSGKASQSKYKRKTVKSLSVSSLDLEKLLRTTGNTFPTTHTSPNTPNKVDYFALDRQSDSPTALSRENSNSSNSSDDNPIEIPEHIPTMRVRSPKSGPQPPKRIVRMYTNTGSMPELVQPKPLRSGYHEILVHGVNGSGYKDHDITLRSSGGRSAINRRATYHEILVHGLNGSGIESKNDVAPASTTPEQPTVTEREPTPEKQVIPEKKPTPTQTKSPAPVIKRKPLPPAAQIRKFSTDSNMSQESTTSASTASEDVSPIDTTSPITPDSPPPQILVHKPSDQSLCKPNIVDFRDFLENPFLTTKQSYGSMYSDMDDKPPLDLAELPADKEIKVIAHELEGYIPSYKI